MELDDYELSWLQRCKADFDVDDATVNVVLRRRIGIALHEICVARSLALESSLAEQPIQESADIQTQLGPQRLIVRLENCPLRSAIERLLEKQREAPHR